MSTEEIENYMWIYAEETGADNIVGLHVCDNFKKWFGDRLIQDFYY